jgi:hypothetical protein
MQTQVSLGDVSSGSGDGDTLYPISSQVGLIDRDSATRTLISMWTTKGQVRVKLSVNGNLSPESLAKLSQKGVFIDLPESSGNEWSSAFELDAVDLPAEGAHQELRIPGEMDKQAAVLVMDDEIRKLAKMNPWELYASSSYEGPPAHEGDFEAVVYKVPGLLSKMKVPNHYLSMADDTRAGLEKWKRKQAKKSGEDLNSGSSGEDSDSKGIRAIWNVRRDIIEFRCHLGLKDRLDLGSGVMRILCIGIPCSLRRRFAYAESHAPRAVQPYIS